MSGFAFSVESFSIGAIVGAVAKALFEAVVKRRAERNESRRKAVREDIAEVLKHVDVCLELGVAFFNEEDAAKRSDAEKKLVHATKLLGGRFEQLNQGLKKMGAEKLLGQYLVQCRQALTMHTGSSAKRPNSDHLRAELYRTTGELKGAVAALRYDAVA